MNHTPSVLANESFTISGKAKNDCTLLKLPNILLHDFREKYDELDRAMTEYEEYLEENGLPYCDYKLYRNRNFTFKAVEKFKYGIKRIIRIVKSYKSTSLTDLLDKVQEKVKRKKNNKGMVIIFTIFMIKLTTNFIMKIIKML
jgi:hypothetical protein